MHSSALAPCILIMRIISGYAYMTSRIAICIKGELMANSVCMHTKEGYACKPARVKYGQSIG